MTGKSVFRYSLDALGKSPFIQSVFRYRFEKIGQTLKLMKPYVVLCQNIKLEAKKPLEAIVLGKQPLKDVFFHGRIGQPMQPTNYLDLLGGLYVYTYIYI